MLNLCSVWPLQTKDCNVVASKLMFLLDDLLWVLTDSQLKAMMKYAESLSEAMEKSAQQRKSLAPEPGQVRGKTDILGGNGEMVGPICSYQHRWNLNCIWLIWEICHLLLGVHRLCLGSDLLICSIHTSGVLGAQCSPVERKSSLLFLPWSSHSLEIRTPASYCTVI